MYVCMYVCMYVSRSDRFGSLRFKSRFKVQGMTDTRWLTYNLASPAAADVCCC